jgi:hypothetical protein
MAAASSTQMSDSRQLGKMIADKFLEKIATNESVPIENICTISPYEKPNNRKFPKAHYYIVAEEKFNYSIFNNKEVKQSTSPILFRINVNDESYNKFIGEYLHLVSYTTDEPFELIIKTLKVPVLNATELNQYADDIYCVYESIDTLLCYYDDFEKLEADV